MGCLGDQQAALVGQKCFSAGEAKNTYGTGAFLILNVGPEKPPVSEHGLLSTAGYQFGPNGPISYCLEGSISVAGAAVRWLRDNLGIIRSSSDIDRLASKGNLMILLGFVQVTYYPSLSVPDTGGVMFVTAFSGLFAPYWRDDARGTLVGLTQYTNRCHIARATLEAVCYSTRAILTAMKSDANVELKILKVDGGMSNSDTCMQIQADVLGIPVGKPCWRRVSYIYPLTMFPSIGRATRYEGDNGARSCICRGPCRWYLERFRRYSQAYSQGRRRLQSKYKC